MARRSVRKTLKFKGIQHYAVYENNRRISGNFKTKAQALKFAKAYMRRK